MPAFQGGIAPDSIVFFDNLEPWRKLRRQNFISKKTVEGILRGEVMDLEASDPAPPGSAPASREPVVLYPMVNPLEIPQAPGLQAENSRAVYRRPLIQSTGF